METKKVTMATVKAFVRKNSDNLYAKVTSSFSGMTDCVEDVEDEFTKVSSEDALGIKGVYTVGSSRDHIKPFEDDKHIGFRISNCCGCGYLVTPKSK